MAEHRWWPLHRPPSDAAPEAPLGMPDEPELPVEALQDPDTDPDTATATATATAAATAAAPADGTRPRPRLRSPRVAVAVVAAVAIATSAVGVALAASRDPAATVPVAASGSPSPIGYEPVDRPTPTPSPTPPPPPAVGPPLTLAKAPAGASATDPMTLPVDPAPIPKQVLAAYVAATKGIGKTDRTCHLTWDVLAGIGRIETDNGHWNKTRITRDGTLVPPILGPVLDGNGFAAIHDTDGGVLDGDKVWDRAVGLMQFIPSTWRSVGADGNHDGKKDPNNVYDAALAAGHYLCAGDRNLSQNSDLAAAIRSYNHSDAYVVAVLRVIAGYRKVDPATLGVGGLIPLATATPTPSATPSHSPSRTPSPKPSATRSPSPSSKPTSTPSAKPTPTPTSTPTPSHSATPTPKAGPTATPTHASAKPSTAGPRPGP